MAVPSVVNIAGLLNEALLVAEHVDAKETVLIDEVTNVRVEVSTMLTVTVVLPPSDIDEEPSVIMPGLKEPLKIPS